MRSEQLEYIAAIARLGSFRQAARDLHISQPALSESVRSLERELGVDVLERGRHGARLSDAGADLMPRILTAVEAVDQLRAAAGRQHRSTRVIRLGTVDAATATFVTDAIRRFRGMNPATEVEVTGTRETDLPGALLGGGLHLGLMNSLDGDDARPGIETTTLALGQPVVCMRPDSPLAVGEAVRAEDLRTQPLIVMRNGCVMRRHLGRLLGGQLPPPSCSTDGAEVGKLMAAEGLGVVVLPSYSVIGDPLLRGGAITWRPIHGDRTRVRLVIQRSAAGSPPRAVADLLGSFTECARAYAATRGERASTTN
jgi:DNA-binding transcriptional LysR family regulator